MLACTGIWTMQCLHKLLLPSVHIHVIYSNYTVGATKGKSPVSAFAKEYNFAAVGCTLPLMKIAPNVTSALPDDLAAENPSVTLSLKSLQVYCDYDCDSYVGTYANKQTHLEFLQRWKMELHTAILLPFDIDLNCGVKVTTVDGAFTPKLSVTIPRLKIAFDVTQLAVVCQLLDAALFVLKRTKKVGNKFTLFYM